MNRKTVNVNDGCEKFAYQHYFMRKKFRMIFHRPAVIFRDYNTKISNKNK